MEKGAFGSFLVTVSQLIFITFEISTEFLFVYNSTFGVTSKNNEQIWMSLYYWII